MSEASRTAVLQAGRAARFTAGATLLSMDSPGAGVFLLLQGFVKVWVRAGDGTAALIAICGPGELTGELSALDNGTRSASVEAAGPVLCRRIDKQAFLSLLEHHSDVDRAVRAAVIAKLRTAARRQIDFLAGPARRRLLHAVLELAQDFGEPTPSGHLIPVPLTQDDWAAMTGITARRVSSVFAQLRDCVRVGYGTLLVTDPERLRARLAEACGQPSPR
ncbi:Crp/Fnr family transcriptional regulator [Dactylosporangium vinaceum]|uniref:Crp/Fnr family transcriptional regulator n=1 Tax=Dactylosporangium vinaceum TaxID=53362 RepID=A0ABV5MT59_9ACTN|nr:Crp/Fnr family transcriptional regulator [Dactylosporangium vinaceum]UAC00230.1 Crp/Fnr family transcriptional regulator [Dactylosporangium vinaceum]